MTRISPQDCATMAEVRDSVDRLDEELVALLAERFRYIEAAARIKPSRDAVRDERRKAEVIAAARRHAVAAGAPAAVIADLWEQLIEASIAHELGRWDAMRVNGAAG